MWFSSWHDGVRCVAIRIKASGLVLSMERPARHCHILNEMRKLFPHDSEDDPTLNKNHEQGFLDRKGKFVDRVKAGRICGLSKPLLSEDVW
jgi:hypothetical protein